MYIIVDGRVRVHDGDQTIAYLGARDIFGELAVLDAEPRSASVTAEVDTHLFRLDQDAFYELMADRFEVARGQANAPQGCFVGLTPVPMVVEELVACGAQVQGAVADTLEVGQDMTQASPKTFHCTFRTLCRPSEVILEELTGEGGAGELDRRFHAL